MTYVYPAVDEKTRTVKVRLELANPKERAEARDVRRRHDPRDDAATALGVPDDAVLDSGTRKVVFVALGEGRFQPREITVGDHGEGVYEVTSGLVGRGDGRARGELPRRLRVAPQGRPLGDDAREADGPERRPRPAGA